MKLAKNRIAKILPALALIIVFQSVVATSPQFDGVAAERSIHTHMAGV